jgi:transcriptional regulator with XRE-family HTH domain
MAQECCIHCNNRQANVALGLNDETTAARLWLRLMPTSAIHSGKTPHRIHYIAEWAAKRNMRQIDVVTALGADKSSVSRWFGGSLPEQPYLERLTALLGAEEINDLFRHPDDTWFKRMFQDRSQKEIDDSKALVEIHLGKTGNDR